MQAKYIATALITMTATPAAGYVFDGWTGETSGIDDPTQNPVTFTMGNNDDDNREITAVFLVSDLRCKVRATCEPSGGGSVSLDPEQPSGGYSVNTTVTARAVAQTGYVFSHWSSSLAGIENPRTMLVSEDNKSVTAVFLSTIKVSYSPTEGGSCTMEPESPGGYVTGTEVTVTAKAAKGYRFDAWEGDASGSDESIRITMDEAKTLTARFVAESPTRRWWLWVIVGLVGLLGALIFLRVVYALTNRKTPGEPPWEG